MNSREFANIARRLMSCPAAPYHEHAARAEVEKLCDENNLRRRRDQFGNVLVRLQNVRGQRPFVLAAHLDHPGFEIVGKIRRNAWRARFLGGVPDEYFKRGTRVRLLPGNMPARLGRELSGEKEFEIRTLEPVQHAPAFAVWELTDFALRNGMIQGRACDDLIGVAAILAVLIELKRSRARVNVIGVISRAEEVGFHGALALASAGELPKNSLVVSLETSRELLPAKMGEGVIIRVGDRASVFDSCSTRFLQEAALKVKATRKDFQFQRALMYGGTCEATAYQEFGFRTAAVCVALGNYHNCAAGGRIRAEYVSLSDAKSMVDLLVAGARQMRNFDKLTAKLPQRLQRMALEARRKL